MRHFLILVFEQEAIAETATHSLAGLQRAGKISVTSAGRSTWKDGTHKYERVSDFEEHGTLGELLEFVWRCLTQSFSSLAFEETASALMRSGDDPTTSAGQPDLQRLKPGQAALFLVFDHGEEEAVTAVADFHPTILRTNLLPEVEARLRHLLQEHART